MLYAILSDLHANESALRRALADARERGAERIVCLGDVVGYGPLPKETLALVRREAFVVLAGNHDDAVSGRQGADDFIDLAGEAVRRHRDALDAADLAWLRTLPYTCELDGAIAAHGDFVDPPRFGYVDDEASAAANFAATTAQLMFVGHTHVPGLFLTGQSGATYRLDAQDFTLEDGKRYLVNPGSVGYPREANGICVSTYVLYDSVAGSVFFRRLPFAVSSVMQRGTGPRRRRTALLVAVGTALVAAAAAAFFAARRPPPEVRTVTVRAPSPDDRQFVVDEKELALGPEARAVSAKLKLAQGSAPVRLRVAFLTATGAPCGAVQEKTVKHSAADRVTVPPGAASARFTVFRLDAAARPEVAAFAPVIVSPPRRSEVDAKDKPTGGRLRGASEMEAGNRL